MATSRHRWIIDEIDQAVARIEVDGRETCHLPGWLLPETAREGDVLAVTHRRDGGHSSLEIVIDAAAKKEALERSRAQVEKKLPPRPGGDIVL